MHLLSIIDRSWEKSSRSKFLKYNALVFNSVSRKTTLYFVVIVALLIFEEHDIITVNFALTVEVPLIPKIEY